MTINNGHVAPDILSPFDDPELSQDIADLDLDALRTEAIRAGYDLSKPQFQQQIAARRAKALELAERTAPNRPPEWFYKLRSGIQSFGNALLLGLMLILSYALLPVAIVGLFYAEIQRVSLGVALFDAPRADLMAVVAVSTYLILLVVRAGMVRQNPAQQRPIWSLRLWLGQIAYLLGLSRRWQPQQRTEIQLLDIAISRLGWLIILLGTAGSLKDELSGAPGAWYAAVWHILTESSLMVFLALVGGITLTAGLLAGLHYTVGLADQKWQRIIPDGGNDFLAVGGRDGSGAADLAEIQFLQSLITKAKH